MRNYLWIIGAVITGAALANALWAATLGAWSSVVINVGLATINAVLARILWSLRDGG